MVSFIHWIFENKIKAGLLLFLFFFNIRAAISIIINLKNYNKIEKAKLIQINEGGMSSGGTSRGYIIQDSLKNEYRIAYADNGNGLPIVIGDKIDFINIGFNQALPIYYNGVKFDIFLPKLALLNFSIIFLTFLGIIFLPKLINRLKNEQNQKITKYLNEKYKNNRDDDNHRIEF